jgi:hypothetical protein
MVVVEGKGGIKATVVADSSNGNGNRITTFELEYHRYIHGEVMTHRLFSRNAMSSRAVPIKKMIEQVRTKPATPIHWGKHQSGMQANEECNNPVYPHYDGVPQKCTNVEAWGFAAVEAVNVAEAYSSAGYHKQIVNRLLEPFQMMKVVLTATEFENFFWLRLDSDAQPEIQELARCMFEAMEESKPEILKVGEWHTPYVEHHITDNNILQYVVSDEDIKRVVSSEEAVAISSSCCAQVSYRNIDNSYEKAMTVYGRLGVGSSKIHASPFENVVTPMLHTNIKQLPIGTDWEEGVTHVGRAGDFWSGNIKGFIQHRQTLENHAKL